MISFLLWNFGLMYLCWILFIVIMGLKRARDEGTLSGPAYYFGLPLLYLGLLVDFLTNTIPASVMFLEVPHEWLFSSRLQRHVDGPDSRNKRLSLWWATKALDAFDPRGYHIKK